MEFSGARIHPVMLLVEDDVNDRRFLQWAIQRSGLSVTLSLAADGEQAIEFLSHPPQGLSLILSDIHLPKRSGWDVLQWIRLHPERSLTPFLIWTSLPNPEGERKAQQLGAASYLSKPNTTDGYLKLVGTLGGYLRD